MNFDVFTVAALTAELRGKLLNGRIQDSLELGSEAVGLEIYAGQRHYLLLSADPQAARVHLVPDRVRRGVEQPSPLGLMLRRYVEGGRVIDITQPPWERILQVEFEGPEGRLTLIAEIMDRRSNLLLVRDGTIMDCMRRIGANENRVRVSLPGQPYVPPPPQATKTPPTGLSAGFLADILRAEGEKQAWKLLTDKLLGFSPMLAKECIYRAAGDVKAKAAQVDPAMLQTVVDELLTPMLAGQFEPGVTGGASADSGDSSVTSFSAYEVTHLPGWHPVDGMSEALVAFYGAPVGAEAYENAKEPVRAQLMEAMTRVSKRLDALQRSHRDQSEMERLRHSGELLLAYQYQIAPGTTTFKAQYDFDQPELEIALDPTLTAMDNAKRYFERYEKAKRAAAEVPALIEAAEIELGFLRQLDVDLQLAGNWPEIGEVQDALQAGGYWRGEKTARPSSGKSAPIKAVIDGYVVWVGRNSRQNEEVTFVRGRPEDTWLHVRGVPGAHVIVKSSGRPVPPRVLQRAAALAAYYSPAREEGRVLVDVTERRHVRKIKGGQPGMVTYRNESPIEAVPGKETQ
jgi:predicted ribosome quality control (RQC) complex YloA/Tae2 family protein